MGRSAQEVVFVDGVRTPFGKAGSAFAETRADDLVVKVIRELLRRNPGLPPERIDEVAVAATTQIGDQGLTIGRTAALLAGLPNSVPGYSIDRMCAGAMTAVTTLSSAIMAGAYDVALAGGVEHMGRHPMGEGVDPNPRFLAETLVDLDALIMGATAENLHDRFPHLTKERADAFALGSQQKTANAYAEGRIQPDLVPVAMRSAEQGWGLPTADEAPRPGTTLEGLAGLKTPFRPHGRVTAGNSSGPQRRRHRGAARRRGGRRRAGPADEDAPGRLRLRRRRARGHGRRPGPEHREGARPRRPDHRRHRPVRGQRGVRRPGAGLPRPLRHRRRRPAGQPDGRRHRRRPPARLLRRPADDPARPRVRAQPEVRYGLTTMCIGLGMGGTVIWENVNYAGSKA